MSSETPNSGHSKPPIPTPAKKVPAWNIEKRGDRLYQMVVLHKWFAITSLLLFVFTVVMIMADYSREWKKYQRNYARLTIERARQDRDKANVGLDRTKLTQYVEQMRAAKKSQEENAQKIKPLQDDLDKLNADFYRIDTDPSNLAWADYPSTGFNKDWIVVTLNMFAINPIDQFLHPYFGENIYVFSKTNLYANGSGEHTLLKDESLKGFTLVPDGIIRLEGVRMGR